LSTVLKRTFSCFLSAALCLALSGLSAEPASAARRRPRPVIVRGSDVIDYGGRARIVGRLKNGRPGQVVALKRRFIGVGRKIVRKKEVNEDLRVVFHLRNRKRTAIFRLVFRNRRGRKRVSDRHRVDVRPHLVFDVNPNDVRSRRSVELKGVMKPAVPDRKVTIKIRNEGKWHFVKRVDVSDGKYLRTFVPDIRGHHRMRATFRGDDLNYKAKRRERLWIYRRGPATWYGPGFYGNTTACGKTLRRRTLGVAHRTLPCGTRVNFLYKGRTITVRVIDRGPYGKADWDLTSRTARRLHFEGRDIIGWWAVR
jgi:rare lipoprotein A